MLCRLGKRQRPCQGVAAGIDAQRGLPRGIRSAGGVVEEDVGDVAIARRVEGERGAEALFLVAFQGTRVQAEEAAARVVLRVEVEAVADVELGVADGDKGRVLARKKGELAAIVGQFALEAMARQFRACLLYTSRCV